MARVRSQALQEGDELWRGPRRRGRGTRSRAASASPPCQRIASSRSRARPSCRKRVWRLTVSTRPMPHSGGVRHSRPVGSTSGVARRPRRRTWVGERRRRGRGAGGRCRAGSPGWSRAAMSEGPVRSSSTWQDARTRAHRRSPGPAVGVRRRRRRGGPGRRGCACRRSPGRACGRRARVRRRSARSRHSACSRVHGCSGRSDDVMPMSAGEGTGVLLLDARARPPSSRTDRGPARRRARRDPGRGWRARRCRRRPRRRGRRGRGCPSAGTPSRRPTPNTGGAIRGETRRSSSGSPASSSTSVGGREERVRRCRRRTSPGSSVRVIAHAALDRDAADGPVLELVAEDAVRLGRAVGVDDAEAEQQTRARGRRRRRAAGRGRRGSGRRSTTAR